MVKRLLFFLLLSCVFCELWSVPADTTLKRVVLKDKRILDFYLHGDEYLSWAVSIDGYTLLVSSQGEYVYGIKDGNGYLRPSSFVAANAEQRTREEMAFLSSVPKGLFFADAQMDERASWRMERIESNYPTTGENNLLVILVSFADRAFTYSQQDFQNLMSQPGYSVGGAVGSVKDYYSDCSFGQLELNPVVAGPYTLSQPMAYYGATGETFSDVNPKEMIAEACALADGDVDFSQFDMNNDGVIDAVHIIFAGQPESSTGETDAIWPHRWTINEGDVAQRVFDGVVLSDYSCSAEKRGGGMDAIGTICHEFGHVLGLPDFYDTDYGASGGNASALSSWSIMASGSYNNGGNTPAAFNAYERYLLSWMEFDTLSVAGNYSLPVLVDSNRAYVITTPYDNEFFVLENRKRTSWDAFVPADGMLIYHIKDEGDYCINCNPSYQRCDIEEADGVESDANLMYDVFPNPYSNDYFTDYDVPNSLLWSGEALDKPLTRISRDTLTSFVNFSFMQPDSSAVVATVGNAEKIATVSYMLRGVELYSGLRQYGFKGFALDTLSSFATQELFAATGWQGDTMTLIADDLLYSHTYYYRATYISDSDTVYGASFSFSTLDGQPLLRTISAEERGLDFLIVGGKKLVEGDYPVEEYGICYDTVSNLSINSNHTVHTGTFTEFRDTIGGLAQATRYYYKVYARTALGVKYGSNVYSTTDYVPIENNSIETMGESVGCKGDDFGYISGTEPTAGQGDFVYLWQQKTSSSSWEEAANTNDMKDYDVGVLEQTTSFRRIVGSLAIRDTSNVVVLDVRQSKGGHIEGRTDWLSSQTDTLRLKKNVGQILNWQHAEQDGQWQIIDFSQQDTMLVYKPAFLDTVCLRALVQLDNCPEAYSDTLKIYVLRDVSLSQVVSENEYYLYPNPTKGKVVLKNDGRKTVKVRLYNTSMLLLESRECFGDDVEMDLSGFASGMYLLQIEDEVTKQVKNMKIILAD